MTAARTGILIGAVLALTWITFGFWAFLFVAFAIAIGGLVGRIVDGKLNVGNFINAVRGKRTSL